MNYPAYPEYKDSGVEWLGEVPVHWKVIKIAHGFSRIGSGTTPPSNESKWYEGGSIPWITTSELREKLILKTKKTLTKEALSKFTSLQVHPPGSLAIAMYGATIGRLGIFGVSATTNQACCVLSGSKSIGSRFAFYWLLAFKDAIVSLYATGGGQPNINQETIASLRLPAPSLVDQTNITIFLDHETARIDALVEEQQRLVALLKEKRQAVISHAVTKGLDPDVPMKDSGVEWLGEVPEHWQVKPLKLVVKDGESISYGIVQPGEHLEEGIPFIQTTNMSSGDFALDKLQRTSADIEDSYPRSRLSGGEVILGIRATIGAAFVVPKHLNNVNLSRGVARIECSDEVLSHFLAFFLNGKPAFEYWGLAKQGSTFNEVSIATVKELPIAVPPIDEQNKVIEHLKISIQEIDGLVALGMQTMSYLKERRSALIAAAVNGKIDVRGWQPPGGAVVATGDVTQLEAV